MKPRHFALLFALVLALFAVRPTNAEAGVSVQIGPGGVYVGSGYGYYPRYYTYRYPRVYYYPRYYYPRYYPAYRYYGWRHHRWHKRHHRHYRRW